MTVRLPLALAVLMLAAPLSGCVDLSEFVEVSDAASRLAVDGVDDPRPLTVPSIGEGEEASFRTTIQGYRLEHPGAHGDEDVQVVPFSSDQTSRRVVRATTGTDAWLRPFDGVAYVYAVDRDASEPDMDHGAYTIRTVYERATGLSVLFEFKYDQQSSYNSCANGACSSGKSKDAFTSTTYPRVRDDVAWGDLTGKTLRVGETIHFEQTRTFFGSDYVMTVDYEVLREESLNGERAFVVDVKTDFRAAEPDHHQVRVLTHHEEHGVERAPEPVHQIWMTSSASVPVREAFEYSFVHNGKVYTTRGETVLESYDAGGEPLDWGRGEPLAMLGEVPEDRATRLPQYFGSSGWGSYAMDQAWRQVEGDLLLRDYRSWKQSHPAARPQAAAFIQGEDERVWLFQLADSRDRTAVASRVSYPTPLMVPVYENRDDVMAGMSVGPHEGGVSDSTPLLRLDEAAKIYAKLGQTRTAEPGVLLRFGPDHFSNGGQATAVFGRISDEWSSPSVLGGLYVGFLEDPVTIDLIDGGLRGVNNDWAIYMMYWSQLPTFQSMMLGEDGDGGFVAPHPGMRGPVQLPLGSTDA